MQSPELRSASNRRRWLNRAIIEKRLEVYDDLALLLNQIFCFFLLVGDYHSITPPKVIERKREADQKFYVYAPLFTCEFQDRYDEFMRVCFRHFRAVGQPASIRANVDVQEMERSAGTWQPEWRQLFEATDPSHSAAVAEAYDALTMSLALEVGAKEPELRQRSWLAQPSA